MLKKCTCAPSFFYFSLPSSRLEKPSPLFIYYLVNTSFTSRLNLCKQNTKDFFLRYAVSEWREADYDVYKFIVLKSQLLNI